MRERPLNHEAGVTLIELLVAVSIMGILMVALTSAVVLGFRSTRDTHTSLDQSNTEQLVTTYITKDIQEAAGEITGAVPGTCPTAGVVFETSTRSNALADPDGTITYTQSGNNLMRRESGQPSHKIADNITCFTVDPTNPVAVTITTLEGSGIGEYPFSFEVRRRQA